MMEALVAEDWILAKKVSFIRFCFVTLLLVCLPLPNVGLQDYTKVLETVHPHTLNSRNVDVNASVRVDSHVMLNSTTQPPAIYTHVDTVTADPATIVSSCTAFINSFADSASEYTKCSIIHSRPFRFCEHCIQPYLNAKDKYNLIIREKTKDFTGASCSDIILNSDRVQIVQKTIEFVDSIWEKCACSNCFGQNNDTMSNDTFTFFELLNKTRECFQNYSQGEIMPFGPVANVTVNRTVCTKCLNYYTELNKYYEDIDGKFGHKLCMDIVDSMNYTRLLWSKDFSCTLKNGDLLPVLLLSALFCLLPIIFYVTNKVYGEKTEKKLMNRRRVNETTSSTESNQTVNAHIVQR